MATLPTLTAFFGVLVCRMQEAIAGQYKKVFKRSEGAKSGANYGWGGLLLRLAEAGPFGALDQTADQHFEATLSPT